MRLVLNADDLGLAPALTRRVVALRAQGAVSDTSLLAGGRSAREAIDGLLAAGVRNVGVHLCLVGGERPLAPAGSVPSLLAGGAFRVHWSRVLAALASGTIRVAEVEREWEEQITRVASSGLAVTHLDSHQHLHLHPALFPVAVRLARRFGVPYVRAPLALDPAAVPGASPAGILRARLLAMLGTRGRKLLAAAGLPDPPQVIGLAEAGRMTVERLGRLLDRLGEGDFEVVLHPGDEDDVTRAHYGWGYAWRDEADALESSVEILAAHGTRAVDFAALAR
jgi:predicted glycoside hydrolase/deacetylase ChbG (UPF0249 family)